MEEITKKQGRTILFVSHNMAAIRQLCGKTILLDMGKIKVFDDTEKVINHYLNNENITAITTYAKLSNKEAQVVRISILGENMAPQAKIPISENFFIEIEYDVSRVSKNALLSVMFYTEGDLLLLSSESDKNARLLNYMPGTYKTTISIPSFLFNVGTYHFDVRFHRPGLELVDHKQNIHFEILDIDNPKSIIFHGHHMGKIASILDYQTIKTA